MAKQRLEWLDSARGIAMALVIFAHAPIPTQLMSFIYSFHVPLFFIISGFLLQRGGLKKIPKDFIRSKFMQLVVPYFFFAAVTYILRAVIRGVGHDLGVDKIFSFDWINGTLMEIRWGDLHTVHNGGLWFICALFVTEVTFYFLYKFLKGDKSLLAISLVVSMVLATIYMTFIKIQLPWGIDTVPIAIIFLGLGYYLSELYPHWERLKKRRYFIQSTLAVTFTLCIIFWFLNKTPIGRVDMFLNYYGSMPMYILAAFFGSIAVMILFESIFTKTRALAYIGKNSLTIYALHQWVIFSFLNLLFFTVLHRGFPFLTFTSWEKLGNGVVYLILTLLLLVPFVWILNKYFASFVGRGGRYTTRGWIKRRLADEPIGLD